MTALGAVQASIEKLAQEAKKYAGYSMAGEPDQALFSFVDLKEAAREFVKQEMEAKANELSFEPGTLLAVDSVATQAIREAAPLGVGILELKRELAVHWLEMQGVEALRNVRELIAAARQALKLLPEASFMKDRLHQALIKVESDG